MIRVRFETRPTRALCFDLENRPLAYWYDGQTTSEITAFGWKWSDEQDVKTMLLLRTGRFQLGDGSTVSEQTAYRTFAAELGRADLVYGHNIRRHDLPMLQAGLLRRELPMLPELRTSDTCRDIPKRGGVSASLENLAAMYSLGGEKFTMSQPAWEKANRLTPDGLGLARRRVASDVLLQEALRDKLVSLGILRDPKVWRP